MAISHKAPATPKALVSADAYTLERRAPPEMVKRGDAATPAHLSKLPTFAPLGYTDLATIAPLFILRSCAAGGIVSREGQKAEYVNFILSGRVQGCWRDQTGTELKLGIFGPGDHLPQVVLAGEPALVSHVAISDVLMASIRVGELVRLLESRPQVAVLLLVDVIASFRRLLRRTKMLTMEGVYGRVVDLLVNGTAELDNHRFAPMTHAEIGRRVGATREMVGRIMRDLARGGYIETERGRVRVLRQPPARW